MHYLMVLFICIFILIINKIEFLKKKKELIIKVFSILLLSVYLTRLFQEDVLNNIFNIFRIDVVTNLDADSTWILSRFRMVNIILLRWFHLTLLTIALLTCFFKIDHFKKITSYFGAIIILFNIVFYNDHLISFSNNNNFFTFRSIQFFIENILLGTIVFTYLTDLIINKEYPKGKEILKLLGLFLIYTLALVPQSIFYNFFGNYKEIPKDFEPSHLIVISIPFISMLLIYWRMKDKTYEERYFLIIFLSLSAFFQYFYVRRPGLAALPLHLCNTAVILMVISIPLKLKGLFYFNYFANVIGALSAILVPNYTENLFKMHVIHFGFNHLYAFIIPILAVALKIFERPKIKLMYKAIIVFTMYYILVVVLNAYTNAKGVATDYFFVYDDFLTDKFGVRSLQYDFTYILHIGGLDLKFFYLYQVLLYFIFIFLMFMTWFAYDIMFRFFDSYFEMTEKKKLLKIDILKIKKEYQTIDGSQIKEGEPMIKIENFTKKYGKSEVKAVDNFSLLVKPGEVFGFIGHNGAGKSTTIKSIVGIQSITQGKIEICGFDIKLDPLNAKLNIGYVSDNHAVYEKLTGREYIDYVADLYKVGKEDREERLNDYLQKFNLAHAIDNEIKSYSHGMKQKIVVIASLIHNPKVWVLDEPLTGLDPTSAFQIKETMREHANKGNVVFFSSHIIEVVEKICDRIALIGRGKLEGVYDVKELIESGKTLEELYLNNVQGNK